MRPMWPRLRRSSNVWRMDRVFAAAGAAWVSFATVGPMIRGAGGDASSPVNPKRFERPIFQRRELRRVERNRQPKWRVDDAADVDPPVLDPHGGRAIGQAAIQIGVS